MSKRSKRQTIPSNLPDLPTALHAQAARLEWCLLCRSDGPGAIGLYLLSSEDSQSLGVPEGHGRGMMHKICAVCLELGHDEAAARVERVILATVDEARRKAQKSRWS